MRWLAASRQVFSDVCKKAVGAVVVINLALAVAAMFKDVVLASYMGTSAPADAFLLAYFIPDTVGNNLFAFALSIACVPVFARLLANGDNRRLDSCLVNVAVFFLLVSISLAAIFYLARHQLIFILGPGFDAATRNLSVCLLAVILPAMAGWPLVAILTAYLQAHQRFNIPAAAPLLFNLVFLAGMLGAAAMSEPLENGVFIAAGSILAGVVTMVFFNVYGLYRYRTGISLEFPFSLAMSEDTKKILRIFLPLISILLSMQAVYGVERYLASNLSVGSVAGLSYAFRLAQFPMWVFVSAVVTVIFPTISMFSGLGRMGDLKKILGSSLRIVFIITLPMTTGLLVLREPIVSILFERGSFDHGSVLITSAILAGYALTVVFQSVTVICLRGFLAMGCIYPPLICYMAASAVNIAADIVLVGKLGAAGLGYGAALGSVVNALLHYRLLNTKLQQQLGRQTREFVRIAGANAPLLIVFLFLNLAWPQMSGEAVHRLGFALLTGVLCLMVYIPTLKLLKVTWPEINLSILEGGDT